MSFALGFYHIFECHKRLFFATALIPIRGPRSESPSDENRFCRQCFYNW